MDRNEGRRRLGPIGRGLPALALLAVACAPGIDPFSERCLEALAYREPAHGEIEATSSRPGPSGTAVAIRYLATAASGAEQPQQITCEFQPGERWRFHRITLSHRALSEAELALVNAEFLLRDLDRHPERFRSGPAMGGVAAPAAVAAGPRRPEIPTGAELPADLSGTGSLPPTRSQL